VSKNIDEIFKEENFRADFWTVGKKIGVFFIALFFAVAVVINTTGCTQKEDEVMDVDTPVSEIQRDTIKVGDDGVNGAIATDDVAIVSNQEAIKNNSNNAMVAMSVEDAGRSDPFLPTNEQVVSKPKPKGYDLLPPPEAITVDTSATELLTTKVSGIMYDSYNPSAILNISGSDYLVRTGDVINGCKVLAISRQSVTVQNGANVYKAGVGELFASDAINFNTISNLDSKFGGRKNSANKR
jgi:Tfp pilus assembly protein PilP